MTAHIPSEELLACAVRAARTAGQYALQNLDRRGESISRGQHDVKLKLDVECQEQARLIVHEMFPAHAVLGEEDLETGTPGQDGYQWVIDPIDGTVNFSHGLPWWCCSVAARRGEEVIAGCVYGPEVDELYTATIDGPAYRDGSPLCVSDTGSLADAIVYTGVNQTGSTGLGPLALLQRIAPSVQRPRIVGSAALDICRVAAGEGDGYFEAGIYVWDAAAAGLLVRRAGGRTEILKQAGHGIWFMATNGAIHDAFKQLLNSDCA